MIRPGSLNVPLMLALCLSLLGGAFVVTPARAASIVVNHNADTVAVDGNCTLREAITAANTDSSSGAAAGECGAGSGPDTITFAPSLSGATITLSSMLPVISGNLMIDGSSLLSMVNISGNNAVRVMYVGSGAALTINSLAIVNGRCADCDGGGIFNQGTLDVVNSFFVNNQAAGLNNGGGIYNASTMTLSVNNSTFQSNSARLGGGIMNADGFVNVTNSVFIENSSTSGGGGVSSFYNTTNITNSTFYKNTAGQYGGGVLVVGGITSITHSTFLNNNSGDGSNLYSGGGTTILKNTLLSTDEFLQVNCSVYGGVVITAGADNLATDATCASATPILMSQLNVGTLASNGGPTQTIALLPGSAAIDAGDAAVCAATPVSGLDQRGVARPFGSGCDVGAYEYTGSAPTVTITPASYSVDEQAGLNLHGTGISVDDADGDPLTVTVSTADAGAEFTANVGATGAVIVSGNGTNTLQLSGSIAQLNDFFAGSSGAALTFLLDDDTPVNSLTMTVTADDGNYSGNDTAEIDMIQVNDAPVNTIPGGQTTNEDAALVFDAGNGNVISINDADVDSGSLEVTLTVTNGTLTLAGITGLSFTTGDGTADASLVFTGSLADINNALAALTFNPSANYNGAAVLSLTSSDRGFSGTGGVLTDTDTVNITIHAVNDAPFVANPIPNQTANEDAAFNFQFAANTFNDLDIGDTLTYSAQLAGGGALPGWLSFDSVTRTFSGTPANNDVGTITLQVTANDGAQTVSDNFDLMIINTNDPPVLDNAIPDQNAFETFPFNYQFPVNTFSDPDVGDTFTYSAQLAGGGVLPAWLVFDPATRTFSGTPTSLDNGSVAIDVIADDGDGGMVTDTFNIVVTNVSGAPFVANPIPNQTATEDAAFNFQFAANTFNDPDVGDTLTYSAQLAGGGALPAWLSFDPVTRTFSGTPTNGDVGTITLQVTANDGVQSVSDNFDLMIMNTNDAPVIDNPIPDQNALVNFAFNYQFSVNTFSDPDVGDILTYSVQLAGGGALPAWLSFDPATRTFSGTPISLGTVSIDVIADDGNGGSVTDTFNIVVANANNAPFVANPIPDQSATEDTAFNFQFAANTFSDPDVGDTLTYSEQLTGGGALPAWLSFDPVTRTFSGTPANGDVGTISIDVVADDGNGGAITDTFNIVIFDKDNPTVTRVNVTNLDGTYTIGDDIFVTLTFDQNVTVDISGGSPTVLLETGSIDRAASYISGSGSNTLTFTYTVQPGDQNPDLDYESAAALTLNGAVIRSAANLDALLTLPAPGGANSIAGQHDIVITSLTFTVASSTLQAVYTSAGPSFFAITFSEEVNNSGSGSGADDVTNPANYLLVEDGADGIFDTTSCISGFDSNDTLVSIAGVTYVPNTAVVTLSAALPTGSYRLFVCGTTSIVNLAGLPLSGDGVTSGTDYIFDFVVNPAVIVPSTSEDAENLRAAALPKTGFAPNKITTLPPQPAGLTYTKLDDLVLEIPSLNVKSTIVGVPQNADNTWDVTWLNNDTGWLNGTAFPTWQGNSVLTAHVTNASGLDGPFALLKSLQYGDQVIVHMAGSRYTYEVRNTRLVFPYAVNFAFESLQDHSYLTLITCQGYNLLNESYLFRRVVRAVLVEVK